MEFDTPINRLGTYCTQWDFVKDRFGKDGLLPFTISDMDVCTAPEVLQSLKKRISHGIFGYTRWDHSEYKGAIVTWYALRFRTSIQPEWIAYAPNVIYAVVQFLQILNPQKDPVCVITPCYDGFTKILKENTFPMITVPMDQEQLNWKFFEQQLSKSKVLLLCNPNNPNGYLWSEEELTHIVELCKKYQVSIISDDIHMDFVYAPHKFVPIVKIAQELDYFNHTVIITSSSKTFNLSSLGGAYIVCPNQDLKATYLNILQNRDSLGSAMSLHVESLIAGYTQSAAWVDEMCAYYYANLELVRQALSEKQIGMDLSVQKATYFAWIDCTKMNLDTKEIQDKLVNIGKVAIMDGDRYHQATPFLRMVIACPKCKVEEGLNRIFQSFK
ncbi:MAG: MalY/PatB family protein [Brevinema sp.]